MSFIFARLQGTRKRSEKQAVARLQLRFHSQHKEWQASSQPKCRHSRTIMIAITIKVRIQIFKDGLLTYYLIDRNVLIDPCSSCQVSTIGTQLENFMHTQDEPPISVTADEPNSSEVLRGVSQKVDKMNTTTAQIIKECKPSKIIYKNYYSLT